MGGNINGRFADQTDIVTTGIVLTSNNNNASLNAAIAEVDHLRGTTAALQPSGLLNTLTNDIPSVTQTLQGTVGAALAGIGQQGTPSEEEGGGGVPCFIGTVEVLMGDGTSSYIREVMPGDMVMTFNSLGLLQPMKVTDKFIHLVKAYTLVTFAEGGTTGLIEDHRYWQRAEKFLPIRDCETVWHYDNKWQWDGGWSEIPIISREVMEGEVLVYNLTVEGIHTYFANGDAVSNLKPQGEPG